MTDFMKLASLRARRAELRREVDVLMKKLEERLLPEGTPEPYPGFDNETPDERRCDAAITEIETIDRKIEELKI